MRYEIIQTKSYPAAEFEIQNKEGMNSGKRLDRYQVTAQGNMAGFVALLFGVFWDRNAFHKSDTYYEKSFLISWGKEKKLYDPSFKDSIID